MTVLKTDIQAMDLWDYISKGGFASLFSRSEIGFDEVARIEDEHWKDENGAIISIFSEYWQIDFNFDAEENYTGESLKFFIPSTFQSGKDFVSQVIRETSIHFLSELSKQLSAQNLLNGSEAFSDADEVVVFLANGMNMHFAKLPGSDDFIIQIITSPGFASDATRGLVRKTLNPLDLGS